MGLFSKKKKTETPLSATQKVFPSGICVRTEVGHWYINGNYRHRLGSKRIFQSWSFPFVAETTEESLKNYRKGKKLGFRDGSLIRNCSDYKLYFISKRQRRLVTDPSILYAMGLHPKNAVWVSDFEVQLHEEGENLG